MAERWIGAPLTHVEVDMKFGEALAQAWSDVQEAGLPAEYQEYAFKEALKHYTGQAAPAAAPLAQQAAPPAPNGKPTGGTRASLDVLATETEVAPHDLERVFYLEGDTPVINVSARKLGSNNAERHRSVALLISVARHFGLDEVEVSIDVVREACVKFGFYDGTNFATYMGSVPGVTLSGPRSKRVLRPRPEAKSKFKQKIAEILGTAEASAE